MPLANPVPLTEARQDVHAFRSELPNSTLERKRADRFTIGGLDESSICEPLTHRSRHLFGHREGGCGRRSHDPGRVFRVRHAVGLGEFERPKVVDGFFRGKGMLDLLETYSVRRQGQADHEG